MKLNRVSTAVMLLAGSHRGLRVVVMGETDGMNEWPTFLQGCFEPIPANAKIAIATKPMRVNPATFAGGDDLNTLIKVCADPEWVVRYGAIAGLENLAKQSVNYREPPANFLRSLAEQEPEAIVKERIL